MSWGGGRGGGREDVGTGWEREGVVEEVEGRESGEGGVKGLGARGTNAPLAKQSRFSSAARRVGTIGMERWEVLKGAWLFLEEGRLLRCS